MSTTWFRFQCGGFHLREAECWIKDVKRCKTNKILMCVCLQIGLERAFYKILAKLFQSVTEATEQMCLKPKLVKCRASFNIELRESHGCMML